MTRDELIGKRVEITIQRPAETLNIAGEIDYWTDGNEVGGKLEPGPAVRVRLDGPTRAIARWVFVQDLQQRADGSLFAAIRED